MSKRLFFTSILIFIVTVGFSWFFMGVEMLSYNPSMPMGEPEYDEELPGEEPDMGPAPGEFQIFPAELFARLDIGPIYFMLPFATIEPDFSIKPAKEIVYKDYGEILKKLGVGIALKANLFGFYIKAAADMPIMEWMETAQYDYKHLWLKLGVGTKIFILGVEGGMVYSIDFFENEIYGGSFGQFFIAAGLAF